MKTFLKLFTIIGIIFGIGIIPNAQARVSFGVYVGSPYVSYGINNYGYYPYAYRHHFYHPYYGFYPHGYRYSYRHHFHHPSYGYSNRHHFYHPHRYRSGFQVYLPISSGYYGMGKYHTKWYKRSSHPPCRVYSHKRFYYGHVYGKQCVVKHHKGWLKYNRYRIMR